MTLPLRINRKQRKNHTTVPPRTDGKDLAKTDPDDIALTPSASVTATPAPASKSELKPKDWSDEEDHGDPSATNKVVGFRTASNTADSTPASMFRPAVSRVRNAHRLATTAFATLRKEDKSIPEERASDSNNEVIHNFNNLS